MSSRYGGGSSSYGGGSSGGGSRSNHYSNKYGGGSSSHGNGYSSGGGNRGGYSGSDRGGNNRDSGRGGGYNNGGSRGGPSSSGGYGGGSNRNNNMNNNSGPPRGGMNNKGYHPNQDVGNNVRDVDWSRIKLEPFVKAFYQQSQSKRTKEEIDQFRRENEIFIKESHCQLPDPFISWDETYFPGYIMHEIKKANFTAPSAIQSQSFPIILSGHDFIGIAKTGSGKTLSFLLPSVVHINAQPPVKKGDGPIVLVLSPTRELAVQIQDECQKFGASSKLTSTCVYGGADKHIQREALQKGVDILIATPGRLLDFLDRRVTTLNRVTYLVLDEADRMLDMGFEPQIRKLLGQIRPDRQTLMFSATWPKEVQQLAKDYCQEQPIYIQIGNYQNTVNKDIRQIVEVLGMTQKQQRLVKYLDSMEGQDKVLVFCATKKSCENISQVLRREQFPALPLHGDKTQQERDQAMDSFKAGSCRILCATDVASRGLDIKNVTFVINYDMTKNIEDYIHRIGRTGRAGCQGTAITFMTYEEDKRIARDVMLVVQEVGQEVPFELQQMVNNYQDEKRKQAQGNKRGGRSRSPKQNSSRYNTGGTNSFREYKEKASRQMAQSGFYGGGGQQSQPSQMSGSQGGYGQQSYGGYQQPPQPNTPYPGNGMQGQGSGSGQGQAPPPSFGQQQQQQQQQWTQQQTPMGY